MSQDRLHRDLNFSRQDTPSFLEGSWWNHALMAKANSVRLQKKKHQLFKGLLSLLICPIVYSSRTHLDLFILSFFSGRSPWGRTAPDPLLSEGEARTRLLSTEHQQWAECQENPRIQDIGKMLKAGKVLEPISTYKCLQMLSLIFQCFLPHPLGNSPRFYHVFLAIQRRWLRKVLLRAWRAKNQAPERLTV